MEVLCCFCVLCTHFALKFSSLLVPLRIVWNIFNSCFCYFFLKTSDVLVTQLMLSITGDLKYCLDFIWLKKNTMEFWMKIICLNLTLSFIGISLFWAVSLPKNVSLDTVSFKNILDEVSLFYHEMKKLKHRKVKFLVQDRAGSE